MKKFSLILLLIIWGSLGYAQNKETRNLSGFSEISVSEAIRVTLVQGSEEKAVIEVSGTETENVLTDVSGDHLKVHMASGNWKNVSADVTITYKQLDEIEVSSAAKLYAEETIKSSDMEIEVSSAGYAEIALDAGDLEVGVSSAGKLELEGKADSAEFEVSSAGSIDAYDLICGSAEVSASSAGSIKLTVTNELEADASGAGSVHYKGDPKKAQANSHGGGSVKKVN